MSGIDAVIPAAGTNSRIESYTRWCRVGVSKVGGKSVRTRGVDASPGNPPSADDTEGPDDGTCPDPQQRDEADRIERRLLELARSDIRELAEMLAAAPDAELLGPAEYEVRDRVHRIGARAVEVALEGAKRGLPRVEPELPDLSRAGQVHRIPAPDGPRPARAAAAAAGLLSLRMKPRPLAV